ncbi:SPOR domain-containing protein [Sphingomicrobium lutaoense]|uniref:SPOR domain-containing protein n=1 Tax=Sphingomicrobium lutaoense TaxID=515949 RepID=A0A839YWH8_9SPHN|nr:SPOR domain-containing protein [Sphingomicrobium lutaoense]MBB3763549.1 hypothetical protein [Sphingomicrobium lutaoense]
MMKQKFFLAIAAAMVATASAPSHAQSVEEGIGAWQAGNHVKAVSIWRPLADRGDADAAFNMGQAYRLGRGVPTNFSRARHYFEIAGNKGHVDAQTNLGLILFNNGDRTGALRWLRLASEQGDPRAMLVYGTALFNGDGVPIDQVSAYAYVSRAAASGLGPAQATKSEMNRLLPEAVKKEGRALAARQTSKSAAPPQKSAARAAPKIETPATRPAPAKSAAKAPEKPAAKAAPKPAAKKAEASSATGPWRVQLGAFSQRSSASGLFEKVKGHKALAGKRSFLVAAGKVTRLQVGPFASSAQAKAACQSLSASGQACFPVKVD